MIKDVLPPVAYDLGLSGLIRDQLQIPLIESKVISAVLREGGRLPYEHIHPLHRSACDQLLLGESRPYDPLLETRFDKDHWYVIYTGPDIIWLTEPSFRKDCPNKECPYLSAPGGCQDDCTTSSSIEEDDKTFLQKATFAL